MASGVWIDLRWASARWSLGVSDQGPFFLNNKNRVLLYLPLDQIIAFARESEQNWLVDRLQPYGGRCGTGL